MTQKPDLISAAEAAELLGCSESNVRALIARGSLPNHSLPASLRQPRRVQTERAVVLLRAESESGRRFTPPGMISVTEAAERAGVHRSTVLGWIGRGKLSAVMRANNSYALDVDSLVAVERVPAGRPALAVEEEL